MRLTHAIALAAVGLIAAAASAQTPKPSPGVRLVTPPAMLKPVPVLSGAEADLATTRKIATAGRWGLAISLANLKPSFWVTPQAAAHANGATLSVLSTSDVAISFGASGIFPYGNVPLRSSTTGSDMVTVGNVPATPKEWFRSEEH